MHQISSYHYRYKDEIFKYSQFPKQISMYQTDERTRQYSPYGPFIIAVLSNQYEIMPTQKIFPIMEHISEEPSDHDYLSFRCVKVLAMIELKQGWNSINNL